MGGGLCVSAAAADDDGDGGDDDASSCCERGRTDLAFSLYYVLPSYSKAGDDDDDDGGGGGRERLTFSLPSCSIQSRSEARGIKSRRREEEEVARGHFETTHHECFHTCIYSIARSSGSTSVTLGYLLIAGPPTHI